MAHVDRLLLELMEESLLLQLQA
jgi:hypothetical protein